MSWIEISCEVKESLSASLSARLESLGALAISYHDATGTPILEPAPGETPFWSHMKCVGLFPQEADLNTIKIQLMQSFPDLIFETKPLEDQDWTRAWLDHFRPLSFGNRLWIMPSTVAVVKLDPGLAFGTGTHPTTALCLRWLNDHEVPATVIDYGCGSGILAIAAKLLGAHTVWAIDYDLQALHSTRENTLRNQLPLEAILTYLPEELPSPPPQAELVMANILAEPLIALASRITELCAPGGSLILSGLLSGQIASVRAAYQDWFEFEPPLIEEDWVLLSGKLLSEKRCISSVEPV